LELYLPYCHSLKEKRRVVRSTADRLRSRFNISVSELDHQELWQRARIGAAAVGPSRAVLEQLSERFIRESENLLGGDLINYSVEIIEHE
jgi:uncharacterized protein YlxP (DUF503 family)